MKSIYLNIFFLICVLSLSCNSNDQNESDTQITPKTDRVLESIKYTYNSDQNTDRRNFFYDEKNNLIESRDEKDLLIGKYNYDSNNRLISYEFNEYDGDELFFKEVDIISYDNQNRIVNIEHKSSFHSSTDGVRELETSNHKVSYETNKIIKTFDGGTTNRVEYVVKGNLIEEVKLYNQSKLSGDFTFKFDSRGNCISGSGPLLIGSENDLTDNIDLKVIYGSETKLKQFGNPFLNYMLIRIST